MALLHLKISTCLLWEMSSISHALTSSNAAMGFDSVCSRAVQMSSLITSQGQDVGYHSKSNSLMQVLRDNQVSIKDHPFPEAKTGEEKRQIMYSVKSTSQAMCTDLPESQITCTMWHAFCQRLGQNFYTLGVAGYLTHGYITEYAGNMPSPFYGVTPKQFLEHPQKLFPSSHAKLEITRPAYSGAGGLDGHDLPVMFSAPASHALHGVKYYGESRWQHETNPVWLDWFPAFMFMFYTECSCKPHLVDKADEAVKSWFSAWSFNACFGKCLDWPAYEEWWESNLPKNSELKTSLSYVISAVNGRTTIQNQDGTPMSVDDIEKRVNLNLQLLL